MGQRLAPLINNIAQLIMREAGRSPRSVVRGYNIVLSPRVRGLGGELVKKDSDGACQWIPPRYSELFLLGSFSRGEAALGIPLGVEEYYLFRLMVGNGKELFLRVLDNGKEQNITVVNSVPKRVVGAMLKKIGTTLCDSAASD